MKLYLIRHGIATEPRSNIKDEERELTVEGHWKTQEVAKRLHQLGLRFDLILTSPLVRSRQTAEILRSSELSSQIEESVHLAPDGDIYNWLKWLEPHRSQSTQILLVGHQPNLAQWAEILVWGQVKEGLVLKKAGVIGLKLPQTGSPVGCSQLFWLTSPKFLL